MGAEHEGNEAPTVEEALKLKYEQLRQKKLAKQQEQEGRGGADDGLGSNTAIGAEGASTCNSGTHSNQSKRPGGSNLSSGVEKSRKRTQAEPAVVSAAALDPSIIAAVQATTNTARLKAMAPTNSQDPATKKPKLMKLPSVPKRANTSATTSSESRTTADNEWGEQAESQGERPGISKGKDFASQGGSAVKRHSRTPVDDSKIDGFFPSVHEAMERVFKEMGVPRDQVEHKVISALQEMSEQDALRALDQFLNGDMSRIRNKGAYLWGIVRNSQSGSGRTKPSYGAGNASRDSYGAGNASRDSDSSSAADGTMKLLWPEEEQVMTELDTHEGPIIEKEFKFDNHTCSMPPAESLFSDETYVLPELAQVLSNVNSSRAKVCAIDANEWQKQTTSTSLTGRVMQLIKNKCRPEMMSLTWLKTFEVLVAYSLVPREPHLATMRSLHLYETGHTVSALNHFLKINHAGLAWDWTAHNSTTALGGDTKLGGAEERFIKDTQEHWLPPVAGCSDLRERANVEAVWQTAKSKAPYDLVLADGCGDDEGVEAADGESGMAPLMLAQLVAALGALAQGGSLVLRAGTLCEHSSVSIMYLVNCCFSDVMVARPCAAASCVCEVYVVCKGFKGIGQAYLDRLLHAVGRTMYVKDGVPMAMMPKSFLSPAWLSQMRSCSDLFARLQSCMIERELRLLNKHLQPAERAEIFHMRDKAALHWQARFGCRQLNSVQDRITREGTASNNVSAAQSFAGGRIWYSLRGRFSLAAEGGSAEGVQATAGAKAPSRQEGMLRCAHTKYKSKPLSA